MRNDSVKLLLRKVTKTKKVSRMNVEYISLSEFSAARWAEILVSRLIDVLVVNWDLELSEDQSAKFLKTAAEVSYRVIINSPEPALAEVFTKLYTKARVVNTVVDCTRSPVDMDKFVRRRAEAEGFLIPKSDAALAREMSVDDTLNMVYALSYLGVKKVTKAVVDSYDLRRVNIERRLARFLMINGKATFFRIRWPEFNERWFLFALLSELIVFLRVKTVVGKTPQIRAASMGLSYNLYKDYCIWVNSVELTKLYERLWTVLSLLKWSEYRGVSLLALGLW
jgi:hypothetical protein